MKLNAWQGDGVVTHRRITEGYRDGLRESQSYPADFFDLGRGQGGGVRGHDQV